MITFSSKLVEINSRLLIVLPKPASAKLPSRGLAMIEGTMNGAYFVSALEPDGRGSHWIAVGAALLDAAGAKVGDSVRIEAEPVTPWPEPTIPDDLQAALDQDADVYALWRDITPMARWDWIRWIRSTNNPATRATRIRVAFSKLLDGERRPCCFNRTACTDMEVSKRGVLLTPAE